jgi:hypothetical protein
MLRVGNVGSQMYSFRQHLRLVNFLRLESQRFSLAGYDHPGVLVSDYLCGALDNLWLGEFVRRKMPRLMLQTLGVRGVDTHHLAVSRNLPLHLLAGI